MDLRSDSGVYVATGLFSILVFVVAMVILLTRTGIDIGTGTVVTFTVGFLLFMGVYFIAMVIYRGIDQREDVSQK